MKEFPTPDFPVYVYEQVLDERYENDESHAGLFEGIFHLVFNHVVSITFVPGVSEIAPPWSSDLFPEEYDLISTVGQARVSQILLAKYAVTPNQCLAGTDEEIIFGEYAKTIFYVTFEEFERYSVDLEGLADLINRHEPRRVSRLRDHEVVTFAERRVVASPRLKSYHAKLLCRN